MPGHRRLADDGRRDHDADRRSSPSSSPTTPTTACRSCPSTASRSSSRTPPGWSPTTRCGSAATGSASSSRSTRSGSRGRRRHGRRRRGDRPAPTAHRRRRRAAQPEARQVGVADPRELDLPGPLPLLVRPQVPRDHPRRRPAGARGLHLHGTNDNDDPADADNADPLDRRGREEPGRRRRHVHRPDRVRRDRQHLRPADPERDPRRTSSGYGDAFAGRGASLNQAIEALNPLLTNLLAGRARRSPTRATQPRPLLPGARRRGRIVAPVADAERRAVRQHGRRLRRDLRRPGGAPGRRSPAARRRCRPGSTLLPAQQPVPARLRRARAPPAARRPDLRSRCRA